MPQHTINTKTDVRISTDKLSLRSSLCPTKSIKYMLSVRPRDFVGLSRRKRAKNRRKRRRREKREKRQYIREKTEKERRERRKREKERENKTTRKNPETDCTYSQPNPSTQ